MMRNRRVLPRVLELDIRYLEAVAKCCGKSSVVVDEPVRGQPADHDVVVELGQRLGVARQVAVLDQGDHRVALLDVPADGVR